MNTRKVGNLLENYVHYELGMNKTRGSGSSKHDGDLKDQDLFVIECKYRNKKNINIQKQWINEIEKQAELSDRRWAIASQLDNKQIYITVNFETFKEMYNVYKKYKSTIND